MVQDSLCINLISLMVKHRMLILLVHVIQQFQDLSHIALTTQKPVVMGEYSHAMGNSLGQFDELWDLIYSHEKLQGGFIWDWVDQGLNRKLILTPDESKYKINSSIMGNPSFVDGKRGKAIKLSGLDDWIEIYNHPVFDELTDNVTIEFWIKTG